MEIWDTLNLRFMGIPGISPRTMVHESVSCLKGIVPNVSQTFFFVDKKNTYGHKTSLLFKESSS